MARSASYTTQTVTIQPGDFVQITRPGDFVTCLAAAQGFKIAFDSGAESDFSEGLTFKVAGSFGTVRLRNSGAAVVTVKLAIGFGQVTDNRLVPTLPLASRAVSPDVFQSGAPVAVPAGGAAQIVPGDASRVEMALSHPATATAPLWIGGAGVAVGSGFPLAPGMGTVLTTSGAVYAACAEAVEIPFFETRRGD
jgi:hypothetical protein